MGDMEEIAAFRNSLVAFMNFVVESYEKNRS
jgi:hypothetical protein